jgi:hypothetical protein
MISNPVCPSKNRTSKVTNASQAPLLGFFWQACHTMLKVRLEVPPEVLVYMPPSTLLKVFKSPQ